MHSFWQQIPLVRLIVPFSIGLWCHNHFNIGLSKTLILLAITSLFYFLYNHFSKRILPNLLPGILLNCLCFLVGFIHFQIQNKLEKHHHFSAQTFAYYLVQIDQKMQKTNTGQKSICSVLAGISKQGNLTKVKGNILLYFKNDTSLRLPCYGDVLILNSGFQEISPPPFPGAFDYKKYMQTQAVFHQAYLQKGQWFFTGLNQGNSLLKLIHQWQEGIGLVLKNYLKSPSEIAISEALLYGYDKDLDEETLEAYAKTGTLHVLAVSGMHVGLIFILLGWLLGLVIKKAGHKKYIALFQTLGIWIYSLLCGMSPSILRASIMLSFIIVGKQIKRNSNPFNSLAASAFLLLLFNPNLLFHVGFQLSYMAVAGILAFYQLIYFAIEWPYRLINEIWKIIAVSLASQTLTLPLSIYYFHQFPNYFLVANLIIIPLTSLIIYGGIILIVIQAFSPVAIFLGKVLGYLISLCNFLASWLAHLPGAVLEHIYWNDIQVLLYFILLFFTVMYFKSRNVFFIQIFLLAIGVLFVVDIFQSALAMHNKRVILFAQKNTLVISSLQAQKANLIVSDSLLKNKDYFEKYLRVFLGKNSSKHWYCQALPKHNALYQVNGLNLFIWQENKIPKNLSNCLVLFQGKAWFDLPQFMKYNHMSKAILGPGLSRKKKTALKKIFLKNKIPFHDLMENGAYELSL